MSSIRLHAQDGSFSPNRVIHMCASEQSSLENQTNTFLLSQAWLVGRLTSSENQTQQSSTLLPKFLLPVGHRHPAEDSKA